MKHRILVLAAVLLTPSLAAAHAKLAGGSPAPNAVVKAAPGRVAITFSEPVLPRFVTIAVTDPGGAKLHVMPVSVDAKRPKTVSAVVHGGGKPGRYRVDWAAAGGDMHRMTGSYGFTVRP